MSKAARCSGALGYLLAAVALGACSGRSDTDLFGSGTMTGATGGQGGAGSGVGGSGVVDSGQGATTTGAGGATTGSTTTTSGGGAGDGTGGGAGGGAGTGGASGATGGGGASAGGGGVSIDGGPMIEDASAGGAGGVDVRVLDVIAADVCVPTGMEVCDGLDNDCSGGVDNDRACPDGCVGVAHGGTGYMFCYGSARQSTWQEASTACVARGMHLVRVDNAEEAGFIRETAIRLNVNGSIWLGGSDTADEGRWVWTDGTPFWMGGENGMAIGGSYVNWSSNQPAGGTSQNCLELAGGTDDWHDEGCGENFAFLCEK